MSTTTEAAARIACWTFRSCGYAKLRDGDSSHQPELLRQRHGYLPGRRPELAVNARMWVLTVF